MYLNSIYNDLRSNCYYNDNENAKLIIKPSLKTWSVKIKRNPLLINSKMRNYKFILFIIILLINRTYTFDYCCCLFSKDPFRGYTIQRSQILSFDQSDMDKESIGYKMINQCYRTYNGFPTLESINLLKRDIYTIDQRRCEKDCNYFIREINEKYNIKQEENRENEAKRLINLKKKFTNILTKKIKENTISLYRGKPCKAEITTQNNFYKLNNKNRHNTKGSLKILNNPSLAFGNSYSGAIPSVPTVGDLSIDSENEEEPSYLEIDNLKYNLQLKREKEKISKNQPKQSNKARNKDNRNNLIILDEKDNENDFKEDNKKFTGHTNITASLESFEQEITEIENNSELKLAELLKSNPNYLSLKTNFKPEREFTENDITSEEELKKEIEKLEIQIIYLNKKNKKPIDFILDRFSIQDDVLVKIIKIFEISLDEVVHDIKSYFEDTVYFQFKVADKYNAGTNKYNIKKK